MRGEIGQRRRWERGEGERERGRMGRRGKGRGGKGRAPMTLWHGAPQCLNPALFPPHLTSASALPEKMQ